MRKIADNTKAVKDFLDGLQEGSLDHGVGQFGGEAQDMLDDLKDEYETTFNGIKSELQGYFSASVTGGAASLPLWNLGQVKGQEVIVDWSKWETPLSIS